MDWKDDRREELEYAIKLTWEAHDRYDWPAAIKLHKICLRLDPSIVPAYWMAGALCLQFGRLDEAESLLSDGVARDPDHVEMAIKHAEVATALQNWPEAIRRWTRLVAIAGDREAVKAGRADTEMALRMLGFDDAHHPGITDEAWRRFVGEERRPDESAFFMQFESLGDNCEFGLVQRHFGAEPLGLLRWNAIGIDALITCLRAGFTGFDDPATTTLTAEQGDEFILANHRYGTRMHTFLKAGEMAGDQRERLFRNLLRRSSFLARIMVETLQSGSKLYVHKSHRGVTAEKLLELHCSLNEYRPNHLLYVETATASQPAGSVERIAPNLYRGAVRRFVQATEGWHTIEFADWLSVCRAAFALAREDGFAADGTTVAALARP